MNLNNNRIIGAANPIDSQDAATKLYVDTLQPTYDVYRANFKKKIEQCKLCTYVGKIYALLMEI